MTDGEYVVGMLSRLYPAPLAVRRGPAPTSTGTGSVGTGSVGTGSLGTGFVGTGSLGTGSVGTGSLGTASVAASYLVWPSAARPRLVVPADSPRTAARTAHRQLTGQRLRTRAARLATTAVLGTGIADRVGSRLHVAGPAGSPSVSGWLSDLLGVQGLLLTMPIGPPRATRKPVLQVCDPAGRVLAYVKVGHDALTRGLVRNEAQALEKLQVSTPLRLHTPGVVAWDDWQDLTLLVLEPLLVAGRRLHGPAAHQGLIDAAREIAEFGGTAQLAWADNPMRTTLRDGLTGAGPRGTTLLEQLGRLDDAAPSLRLGSWHGDLNPGNLAALRTGTLVWDWERFEQGVPVGFDLLHHELHQWITEQGVPPPAAARRLLTQAPALLAPLGVDAADAPDVARLYLLTLAVRYLRDNQAEAGSALGHVEAWIPPALAAVPGPASRGRST